MYEHVMTQRTSPRFTIDKAVFFPALILLFGAIAMVLTIPEKAATRLPDFSLRLWILLAGFMS